MAGNLLAAAWRESRAWPLAIAMLLFLNIGVYAWLTYGFSPGIELLERRYLEAQASARHAARKGEPATPRELYEKAGKDLLTFRGAIPDRIEFTGLIEEIFTIAGESGLRIDRVSYSPALEKETNLLRYGLNFSVAGNYGQIKKFISSLEQSPRIIAIEEISLSGGERQEGAAVSLDMRLATYFRPEGS